MSHFVEHIRSFIKLSLEDFSLFFSHHMKIVSPPASIFASIFMLKQQLFVLRSVFVMLSRNIPRKTFALPRKKGRFDEQVGDVVEISNDDDDES